MLVSGNVAILIAVFWPVRVDAWMDAITRTWFKMRQLMLKNFWSSQLHCQLEDDVLVSKADSLLAVSSAAETANGQKCSCSWVEAWTEDVADVMMSSRLQKMVTRSTDEGLRMEGVDWSNGQPVWSNYSTMMDTDSIICLLFIVLLGNDLPLAPHLLPFQRVVSVVAEFRG